MRKKPEDRDRQHIVIDIIDYFGNFAQQWQTRKKYYKKQKYQFDEYLFNDNGNQPVIKKGSPPKEKKIPKTFNKILFLDEDEAEEPQDTEADAEADENPDEPCDYSSEEE
jgi:hypothetical protein